jgi:hypothetical protein
MNQWGAISSVWRSAVALQIERNGQFIFLAFELD